MPDSRLNSDDVNIDGGRISAADAEVLCESGGIDQLLLDLIPLAQERSLSSVSGFNVGAVGQGVSGDLYRGANAEFELQPLNRTNHAEQAVVINAASHGELGLRRLAVSAAPCGYCRQFLFELTGAAELDIILKDVPTRKLPHFLPDAFGPNDLGIEGGLLSPQDHKLEYTESPSISEEQAELLLEQANASYAPYTKAYASAGILISDGTFITAPYLENAAFNPSASPMQAAVVRFGLSGYSPKDIVEASVLEVAGSPIAHALAGSNLLKSIKPSAKVSSFTCQITSK